MNTGASYPQICQSGGGGDIGDIENRITILENEVNDINIHITNIESNITTINNNITTINNQIITINQRMDSCESEISQIRSRVENLEYEYSEVNSRLNLLESRLNDLENRLNSLETRLSTLENIIDGLRTSWLFFNNIGYTGDMDIYLPMPFYTPPLALPQCRIVNASVIEAFPVIIHADIDSAIRVGELITGSGGTVRSNIPGSAIRLISVSNNLWVADSIVGSWEVSNP